MSEGNQESQGEGFTVKKLTLWKGLTGLFAVLFVVSLMTGGFNLSGSGTGAVVADAGNNPNPPAVNGNTEVSISDDDPILGDKDAEISIVEFSDFQCPFCERAYSGALAQFKQSDYFENGEVNLVYKHFPLRSIHPDAQKAGEAAECARRQGKFWEYHDTLFENQRALDGASLKSYASQLGLDTSKFNSCLDNGEATAKVNADLDEATAAGGRGTPYFVLINSDGETQTVSGAVPWSNFESAIKALQ